MHFDFFLNQHLLYISIPADGLFAMKSTAYADAEVKVLPCLYSIMFIVARLDPFL
jgi:hypothetical protein